MNYEAKLEGYLRDIEEALDRFLPETREPYNQVIRAMRYSVLGGGKRVRAILMIEFCKACGGTQEDAMPFACALEMIHAYSLIHDDLPCMDNDELRRGKPSCWKAFGEANGLLAGDGLLTCAFETAAASPLPKDRVAEAILLLARNAGAHGMIGGQVIDLANEGKDVTEAQLLQMYGLKTGALLCCAAEVGCVLAGADREQRESAGEYAKKIGLAFQIVDDILDVTSTADVLGKPIGSDEKSQKRTYVTLNGLAAAQAAAGRLTEDALAALACFAWEDNFLYELTDRLAVRNH